eukprot:CAMPEP_0198116788 /NCGR_PEP_ID=MMETSP1442-20131203/14467_1 /TAXON_ID= /ORGANISM="Craspedostauros australis, Strain CCMP3328" /LENGTH=138 /DNA_ID=CAMNT_0043774695 /DNA_START=136 /DNA_END=552 /DNA_ORIENTATION=-
MSPSDWNIQRCTEMPDTVMIGHRLRSSTHGAELATEQRHFGGNYLRTRRSPMTMQAPTVDSWQHQQEALPTPASTSAATAAPPSQHQSSEAMERSHCKPASKPSTLSSVATFALGAMAVGVAITAECALLQAVMQDLD